MITSNNLQLMYVNAYAYSDVMLSLFSLKYSNWCIDLLSIFLMIYDLTCYVVNNILDCVSLLCFHLSFWFVWWYFVYCLARAHTYATFQEHQRCMSRNRDFFCSMSSILCSLCILHFS